MKFEIKNRWCGDVQFSCELEATFDDKNYGVKLGAAVKKALAVKANLSEAKLSYADLSYADLSCANLSYADLRDANLSYANLHDAKLSGANLSNANLSYANLHDAKLSCANLSNANLHDAKLSGADLSYADLSDANLNYANLRNANLHDAKLSGANLSHITADLFDVLIRTPHEVDGLVMALREGRVDGSQYQGECACLVGTIAKVRKCEYDQIPNLTPDSSRPSEVWFFGINKGDTPENSAIVKLTLEWIAEFQSLMAAAVKA